MVARKTVVGDVAVGSDEEPGPGVRLGLERHPVLIHDLPVHVPPDLQVECGAPTPNGDLELGFDVLEDFSQTLTARIGRHDGRLSGGEYDDHSGAALGLALGAPQPPHHVVSQTHHLQQTPTHGRVGCLWVGAGVHVGAVHADVAAAADEPVVGGRLGVGDARRQQQREVGRRVQLVQTALERYTVLAQQPDSRVRCSRPRLHRLRHHRRARQGHMRLGVGVFL
mmetsp:Transcript_53953/g.135609  ORF Transcript_53953/g.135609 Transcript_53953/m.135609 type:complete len:224 (-) Transcript_53953:684-1355(-)